MATMTYFDALTTIVDFAKAHGFEAENPDALAKVETLRKQKQTKSKAGQKSETRVKNEELARRVVDAIRNSGEDTIRAAWVAEHVEGINTTPKAVAVLNVGTDMGIIATERVEKSATRSELVYKLAN